MFIKTFLIIALSILAIACETAADRLAAEARVCQRALETGELKLAEETCRRAVGDVGDGILAPKVRSERLYRLANIKRQLAKYNEAAELLDQSLTLEQTLSAPDSPQIVRRHLEMSLILAGQGRWQDGALLLEQTAPVAGSLNEEERKTLVNVLLHYAVQLRKTKKIEQAAHLQAAAESLKKEPPQPQ